MSDNQNVDEQNERPLLSEQIAEMYVLDAIRAEAEAFASAHILGEESHENVVERFKTEMRQLLAERHGVSPDAIELGEVRVTDETIELVDYRVWPRIRG